MTRRAAASLLLGVLLPAGCDDGNRASGLGPRGTALPPPQPEPEGAAPARAAPAPAPRPARQP